MAKIGRVLSERNLERMLDDGGFLIKAVTGSRGELYLALRDNYLNVYYRGSSLAQISFGRGGVYRVRIHGAFVEGSTGMSLSAVAEPQKCGEYFLWHVKGHDFHRLLQAAHVKKLQANIKRRNFSEEALFEQAFIWDNQKRDDFIVIDRQVQPRGQGQKKLDLLALRQEDGNQYRFLAIEAKLGNNKELRGPVFEQLEGYVAAVTEHFEDYRMCYEESYRQQKLLGLLPSGPASVKIEAGVEGLVVVFAHSGLGAEAIQALQARFPAVKVELFRFNLEAAALQGPGSLE